MSRVRGEVKNLAGISTYLHVELRRRCKALIPDFSEFQVSMAI